MQLEKVVQNFSLTLVEVINDTTSALEAPPPTTLKLFARVVMNNCIAN